MILEAGKFLGKKFLEVLPFFLLFKSGAERSARRKFIETHFSQVYSDNRQDHVDFLVDYYRKHGAQCENCGQWTSRYHLCLNCGHDRLRGLWEEHYINDPSADVYLGT